VQEAGARVERLLLDVHVYEGKVVPEGFREEDAKPADGDGNGGENPPAATDVPENQQGGTNATRPSESPTEPSQRSDVLSGASVLGGIVVGTSLADRQRQIHAALAFANCPTIAGDSHLVVEARRGAVMPAAFAKHSEHVR
jgi:hypothetical protein